MARDSAMRSWAAEGVTRSRDVAVMKDASPLNHITKDLPPVLLIVGDGISPCWKAMLGHSSSGDGPKSDRHDDGRQGSRSYGRRPRLLEDKSDLLERVREFLRKSK